MKIKIILSTVMILLFSSLIFSQEETNVTPKEETAKKVRFTNGQKQFREWSIQLFAGQPLIYASNLESDFVSDIGKTYDVQLGVTRQLTHSFALQLLGNYGKTKQYQNGSNHNVFADTEYYSVALMGDLNLSSLLRRVDYKPSDFYNWAVHAYGGLGAIAYDATGAYDKSAGYSVGQGTKTTLFNRSYFGQVAVGLRRRISQSVDLELKQTLLVTNDATFDGSGPNSPTLSKLRENSSFNSGNVFITSLGVHYKIGRKGKEHMAWIDPLQKIKADVIKTLVTGEGLKDYAGLAGMEGVKGFDGINAVGGNGVDGKACEKDGDNDGVCDGWDKELATPQGARIDGSGVALDVDLDKVIDLLDKCVVVPGEGNPTGCPEKQTLNTDVLRDKLSSINLALEGIDFDLNSAIIKPQYFTTIDQAGFVMKEFPSYKFNIEGHTDAQGSNYYNYVLSKKRAEAVKKYLIEKQGISPATLLIYPKGETDLKNTECQPHTNCDEIKNKENRRIVFVPIVD